MKREARKKIEDKETKSEGEWRANEKDREEVWVRDKEENKRGRIERENMKDERKV